jgi:hypothetical protein
MKLLKIALFVVLATASSAARGQFADNTVIWSIFPTTQAIGSVNNNLQAAPLSNGMVVFGTWSITIPAGFQSGTLLEFEAARLMQTPAFGPPLSHALGIPGTDYIDRPFVNSIASGAAQVMIDSTAGSFAGWTFPNSGSGTYFYNNGAGFSSFSGPFFYNGGTNKFMRMKYTVDFVYNGPGGTYLFTFPLSGELITVPEPATLWLLITAVAGWCLRPGRGA